jgi:Fe-S cluster assembly protein SufD
MIMETLEKTTDLGKLGSVFSGYAEGNIPAFFKSENTKALKALPSLEFPTRRHEFWKYTPTTRISKGDWTFASGDPNPDFNFENYPARMVFVNGNFRDDLSAIPSIEGVEITRFQEIEHADYKAVPSEIGFDKNPFAALNSGMPQDGVALHIQANKELEKPLHLFYFTLGDGVVSQPRNLIVLGKSSTVNLTEHHIHQGSGKTLMNSFTEIRIGKNASLKLDLLQTGTDESTTLNQVNVEQESDSRIVHNTITLSGGWTRNNGSVNIIGTNVETSINGFYIPSDKEFVDNHTIIDHREPHCNSYELFRGVLLDRSVGVFNGKVFVRQDAQKTNAFQSNGNVLVSDTATMNSKPELEIYADDVKCSHGSTTGQLDDEAMFYLMARGLSAKSARKMLVAAFAEEVLEKLHHEPLREIIESKIAEKLAK